MPIPSFDANGVLPPHTGDPTHSANVSPYPSTPLEFGQRFGGTPDRRQIIQGWLDLRRLLRSAGFNGVCCFQWVDGSFLEDIESTESRAPRDVDVITFYYPPSTTFGATVAASHPVLADQAGTKSTFHVDHYFIDLAAHPAGTVDLTAFWCGLFSHRRDGVWKGLLRIELGNQTDDDLLAAWIATQP